MYDAAHPVAVILFGSRARGDYRDDSDVDLLVITADDEDGTEWRGRYVEACKAAHEKAEAVYGFLMGVDVVDMPASKFADCPPRQEPCSRTSRPRRSNCEPATLAA